MSSFDIRQNPLPYHYPFDENTWNTPSPNDPADGLGPPELVRIVQTVCHCHLGTVTCERLRLCPSQFAGVSSPSTPIGSSVAVLESWITTSPHTQVRHQCPYSKSIVSRVVSLTFCLLSTIAYHIRPSSKKGETYNLWKFADWTSVCGDQKRDTSFSHPECHTGRSPS